MPPGKSSTINALLGAKRVAVGATPGKTKHFQTLFLDDDTLLCDCPGLVFPSFATTAAEMVCNGVLPIDQTREYTGPAALVAQRVPQWVLEAIYGIKIRIKPLEEGGTGIPTAEELLVALAVARGFTKAGQGNPDESRSARLILKDYIAGKLLYNHPPPDSVVSGKEFNAALYDPKSLSKQTHHLVVDADGEYVIKSAAERRQKANAATSVKVQSMDAKFFNHSAEAARLMPKTVGKFGKQTLTRAGMYPHHRMVDDQGRPLVTGDREAIEQVFGQQLSISGVPKKSFKKGKKHIKKRSGQGYDG
ncbi:hypothetical protein H4R35_005068 [Dimargaris xerosporica]|nr:hypothetical protein H4R35_005068 [Dimargaris xerosporica]